MKTTFKKIWDSVSTVLVVLFVLCAIFLMGSRILGYRVFTVTSGSMEPAYSVGDLIYVDQIYSKDIRNISNDSERNAAIKAKVNAVQGEVDNGKLKIGDPITFVQNEELVIATHRIVKIDEVNHKIYTKGDANESEDPPLLYENVIGKVKFSIPLLGYVSNYIQNPPGMYITIVVCVILILAVFLPDFIGKGKKKEEDNDNPLVKTYETETEEENERLKAEVQRLKAEIEKTQADKNQ